ncbi:MAG: hypothetical protein PHR83_15360 [Paludibacter sp.]|nr:hypothetical protein [Paludibacter sp.]
MRNNHMNLTWIFVFSLVVATNVYGKKNNISIYNATDLITLGKTKGLNELEKKVYPTDLVYLDSKYLSSIINIEFKAGFLEKWNDKSNVYIYRTPKYTEELADEFNSKKAGTKLFEYYSNIPKLIKSDTIYDIYGNFDSYLKLLLKFKSKNLITKLEKDYYEWTMLSRNAPKKIYPNHTEWQNATHEDSLRFLTYETYVDCRFIAFQLACALNKLKVKGFENSVIDSLKTKQTWPYMDSYSFPEDFIFKTPPNEKSRWSKIVPNKTSIMSFRKDIKKITEVLRQNFEWCCESRISKIIEDGTRAYVKVSRNNGFDNYLIRLTEDNKIKINLITSVQE